MTRLLDTPGLDRAGSATIAAALDASRPRGATWQACVRAGRRDVWVNAVRAPAAAWPRFSAAASRRAAVWGRRLLPVLGSGEFDGWLWIAFEMGSATSLSDHRRHLLLPTASCLRLLSDVARALDDAAADGVFPHELRPESVFVSRRGARLGDLGTAREALGGAGSHGEAAYVPPEVLRGEPAGERSGVYALGALLYHLLAGASPQRAHSVPLASWRPDLPAAMDSIVAAAMADDPGRRPRSAMEVHDLAKRALRGEGPAPGADLRRPVRAPGADLRRPAPGADLGGPAPAADLRRPAPGADLRPSAPGGDRRSAGPRPPASASAPGPSPEKAGPDPAKRQPSEPPTNIRWSEIAQKIAGMQSAGPSPAPPAAEGPKPNAMPEAFRSPGPAAERPAAPSPAPRAPARPAPAPPTPKPSPPRPPRKPAAKQPAPPAPAPPAPAPPAPAPAPPTPAPPPSPTRGRPSPSFAVRRARAVAIGSLVLGALAGLLLGQSPGAEQPRANVVSAGGIALTVPPGWEANSRGSDGLSVRAKAGAGWSLEAQRVDETVVRQRSGSEPVRLGTLEAWRTAARGVARYAAPTTAGTVVIVCRASSVADADPLTRCERTASTLRLRTASALPLASVIRNESRLRAAIAALAAEREVARRRLARASTPSDQSDAARALAGTHARAAVALSRLPRVESIEAAVRRTAAAYSDLAASSESGSSRRWERARTRVRRVDAALAEALAARG